MTYLRHESGITSLDLLHEMAESLLKARRETLLYEIKATFRRSELVALLDAFNGTLVRGMNIPGRDLLIAQMEDAQQLDGSASRHGYDHENLMEKLRALTHAQAECLLLELRVFWEEISPMEGGLEKFLTEYATA